MKSFTYNDMAFSLEQAAERWNILCQRADGKSACVATGVFAGVPENEVGARALALVKAAFPVGIKVVGPDVTHPTMIGDLKIVGPDVTHPNIIYWDKDSSSCPQQL